MHPESKEKATFISHAELYQFNVLSFGLTNAPPQFQRLVSCTPLPQMEGLPCVYRWHHHFFVIQALLRHEVLVACHDQCTTSHLGISKTYDKMHAHNYLPNMFKDIKHKCNSCVDCAMKKITLGYRKAPLLPTPVEGAFDRVAIVTCWKPLHYYVTYIIVISDYKYFRDVLNV